MRITDLFEQTGYTVNEIEKSDTEGLQEFCDFYNQSGQLSWQLNPNRLKSKLGSKGSAFGLYFDNKLVGSIGLKQTDVNGLVGAEVGYLMIDPNHRSFQNVMLLYKSILSEAKRFDIVFVTTNVDNKQINTLLARTNKFEKVLRIKSPFSSNILYVWYSNISNRRYSEEEKLVAVKAHFYGNIKQEYK